MLRICCNHLHTIGFLLRDRKFYMFTLMQSTANLQQIATSLNKQAYVQTRQRLLVI